jgi:hypothetical protein
VIVVRHVRLTLATATLALVALVIFALPASAEGVLLNNPHVTSSTFDRFGNAHITMVVRCFDEGRPVTFSSDVQQSIGRLFYAEGTGYAEGYCTNGVASHTATVEPFFGGLFRGGTATITGQVNTCADDYGNVCDYVNFQTTRRLTHR